MRWFVVFALAIAACTRPSSTEPRRPEPARVDAPPILELAAPERGAFVDGGTLVVIGHVTNAVRVTVNGAEAALAQDGTFTATIAVTPGLSIVETHAIDTAGHDVRDVRAVLAGPFAPSDGSSRAAIGARLGRDGLAALARGLASSLKATDFSAVARTMNPIFDDGGCLGARVDIAGVAVGKLGLTLAPKPGALETIVTADDVEVRLDIHYKVACLGGSTTTTVRTKVRAHGDLRASVANGRIRTSLDTSVTLDDLRIDIAGVPGPIEGLLRTAIRSSVEHTLAKVIASKVPPLADAQLARLLAKPPSPSVLGHGLRIEVIPRRVELTASGLFVVADTALVVEGGQRGRYVTVPAVIVATGRSDLGVSIAADTINQLLAGLWAAHAFDRSVSIDDVGMVALLLGGNVRTIDVSVLLPPTVSANGALELAIGELTITTRDANQLELQRFAISLRSALAIKPGELALTTSEPTVVAQLLAQSAMFDGPLDSGAVEGIVKGAWSLVAGTMDDALAGVPIPALGGIALEIRGMTARDGVLAIDVAPRSP